ncbi:MAG: hypothetical protein MJE66_02870 [Proteobacteria bacterium]|nr:hypothetical protein [Pseudomonadota bacterium]
MTAEERPATQPACATESRARSESMVGSVGFFDVWVLVSTRARSALELRGLLPPVYLRRNAEDYQRRVQTGRGGCARTIGIRTPGHGVSTDGIAVYVAVPARRELVRIRLPELEALGGLDLDAYRHGEPDRPHERLEGLRLGVCTDGKVDPCCAREGMGLYRRLEAQVGDAAWRVTHLGGCRFASNLIAFPHGVQYGRVRAADVERLVDATRRDEIVPDLYRGRVLLDADANAAEAMLRRARGAWGVGDFEPLEDRDAASHAFRDRAGRVWRVRLRKRTGPVARLTCRAAEASVTSDYECLSIEADAGRRPRGSELVR